jgi:enoyl-CoA hydratase/carnithine racemase
VSSRRAHEPWTQFGIDRRSPGYCRVTFDNPPANTVTAKTVAELAELVGLIEEDRDLNVVVFDSANPECYLAGPSGVAGWRDLLGQLSRCQAISIASIRGCVRGAGSEFVLACDMRFASRENTLLGRFDLRSGVVGRGRAMARLSRLTGAGRALEILLVADDLDGQRAELYGYVNRAVADDRLDAEVEKVAARLARFDHDSIARTKSYVAA